MCVRCLTLCHEICFGLPRVDVCEIRQHLLHCVLHKHVFQHHVFHSSQSSLGCPCFCRLTSTWFMRITSCPNSCQRCFVTIPSAIPVVKAYNSASAELRLTVCCVRDYAVSVFLHVVAWLAQSLSVYTFTNFGGVTISTRHFALGTAFRYLTLLCRNFSCCLLHAVHDVCSFLYNNFSTTVLYIARLSFSSSTSDSVVGVLFTLGVVTGFASSKPRTAITSRMYFGFPSTEYPRAVRSITLPRKKILSPSFSIRPTILIKTCFDKSSTNFQNFTSRPKQQTVINMNENICVRLIVSEATRILSGLGGSSDFPGYSQGVGATVLVLCDSRTVLCSDSTLRLLLVLRHTNRLVLVVLQTNLGRHPRARMLCVRQWQL